MKGYHAALDVLPEKIRREAAVFSAEEAGSVTEFRLRCGSLPVVSMISGERSFGSRSIDRQDLQRLMEICSGASPYAVKESLRLGFITVRGGVRVGFCGEVISEKGCIVSIKNFSSASVRIPRELHGCANGLCGQPFVSTLIISPPGLGKTTLLRDMVRLLSQNGLRVSLCDERGEVAGLVDGVPSFDLGGQTDILSGGKKSETAMMLLRCMTPDVVAMDEITAAEDVEACQMLCHCGIRLLATAHAASVDELYSRPLYRELLARNIFCRAVIIAFPDGVRRYREERLC